MAQLTSGETPSRRIPRGTTSLSRHDTGNKNDNDCRHGEILGYRYPMLETEQKFDGTGRAGIHLPARGPRLMIVHRPLGQMSAVHDHGTWVAIGAISGLETHRRYRVTGEGAAALTGPARDPGQPTTDVSGSLF